MDIQKSTYQYVPLNQKNFIKNSKWYTYFNAIFDKDYFTEDELEFLLMLKSDLEKEIEETDKSIKKLTKTPEKR